MSYEAIHYLNVFLGSGAILLQALSVFILFLLFVARRKHFILDFVYKNYLMLGFLVSLGASLFTLVYSGIVGFIPCYLCWYQRIAMFPLVFIFGIAWGYKDRAINKYVLPLILVGSLISLYQNFIYYFKANASELPCDASGVSCYQHLVSEFGGYISIPMLALTSFIALLTIVLVAHFYQQKN